MLQEIRHYTSAAQGVRRLLREPRVKDHDAVLAEQMARRATRFLEMARDFVFANPANPYYAMLQQAGCSYSDLEASVGSRGLEPTLTKLLDEGVYLTHDEFKGKQPIVRRGKTIPAPAGIFLNPRSQGYLATSSSGSRSQTTPARQSPQFQVYKEVHDVVQSRNHQLHRYVRCIVGPILPSAIALTSGIRGHRVGRKVDKWFSQPGKATDTAHYRAVTHFLVRTARLFGSSSPFPTYLPDNDFLPVAEFIAKTKRDGRPCVVNGFVSPIVRVAAAARAANLDISGTLFLVGGEALTDAKRATVESTGSSVFPSYYINEVGPIGTACSKMRQGNCVHVYSDCVAIVTRMRAAPYSDLDVPSLMFTNLLPWATRFLINAEMDDSGIVEPATCDCEYSAAGMKLQVRDIFSYGKLTGQGITLFGTDVVKILEMALPERFGGGPGDYQLVEREQGGQTEMTLRVSPRTGARSTAEVEAFFLSELKRCYGGSLASRLWTHSHGFETLLAEPERTRTGKVLALHLLGSRMAAHAS